MKDSNFTKALENVYSMKTQRTLSYKIDLEMKQKARAIKKHQNLNSNKSLETNHSLNKHSTFHSKLKIDSGSLHKKSPLVNHYQTPRHSRVKTFIDKQEPFESIKMITQKKQSLNSLYSCRLLPSQFLVTPINVLDKLKEASYSYRKKNEAEKNEFSESPTRGLGSKSKRIKHCLTNTTEFESILKDSCDKVLEDNKKSRKSLMAASKALSRRKILNNILVNNEISNEGKEFTKRLRDAHKQLKNLDLISGMNANLKLVRT